jgi:hypothetical protein
MSNSSRTSGRGDIVAILATCKAFFRIVLDTSIVNLAPATMCS